MRFADGNVVTTLVRSEVEGVDAATGAWVVPWHPFRAKCVQYSSPELGDAPAIAYVPVSPEEEVRRGRRLRDLGR